MRMHPWMIYVNCKLGMGASMFAAPGGAEVRGTHVSGVLAGAQRYPAQRMHPCPGIGPPNTGDPVAINIDLCARDIKPVAVDSQQRHVCKWLENDNMEDMLL